MSIVMFLSVIPNSKSCWDSVLRSSFGMAGFQNLGSLSPPLAPGLPGAILPGVNFPMMESPPRQIVLKAPPERFPLEIWSAPGKSLMGIGMKLWFSMFDIHIHIHETSIKYP